LCGACPDERVSEEQGISQAGSAASREWWQRISGEHDKVGRSCGRISTLSGEFWQEVPREFLRGNLPSVYHNAAFGQFGSAAVRAGGRIGEPPVGLVPKRLGRSAGRCVSLRRGE